MEKNKITYPWKDAPKWAQYAFISPDGEARWFLTKPSLDGCDWKFPYSCDWEDLPSAPIRDWTPPENIDWTKSLEKRTKE